jgi:ring-1,2-phenylacetyl-CoA epoxidase subunit PaaA
MIRICKEESFHQRQGYEAMLALAKGSPEQKAMAQDALNRFYWPALMMFGPHDTESAHSQKSMEWKIKRETNDDLRQKFVDQTVKQIEVLGLEHPDANIKWNEARGHYDSSDLNWDEFWSVINGNGHCNRQRIEHHIAAHEEGEWVRDAIAAYNEKKRAKKAQNAA